MSEPTKIVIGTLVVSLLLTLFLVGNLALA